MQFPKLLGKETWKEIKKRESIKRAESEEVKLSLLKSNFLMWFLKLFWSYKSKKMYK